MLPFLHKKKVAGLIIQGRQPDGGMEDIEENQEDSQETDEGLMAASRDLINAVKAGNEKAVAESLKSAFLILDSMPHEEGPHEEGNDFQSLNQKAAKGE
jgi:hypothetical protein